jgi:Bcr/CflA subfamily drug resistance transporter
MKRSIQLFPLLLVFYELVTYLSNDMYLPALPQLKSDLEITQHLAQLTLSTWFLGTASMQLLLGPISDRYGRRPVLLGGGLVFTISTVVCAMAPDITTLLLARFVQGSTVCSVVVAGYGSINELFDQKQAIRILAFMGSITILAPAFGPLAGSLVLIFGSWRFIFWILAILSLLAFILLLIWMPESNPPDKRRPMHFKSLLKDYLAVVMNFGFLTPILVFGFVFSILIAWIAAGAFIITQEFAYTAFIFGVVQACVFGTYIIGNHAVKYCIERMAVSKVIHIGLLISLLGGLLALFFTMIFPHHLSGFVIALMIYAGGSGLVLSPLSRIAIESCQEPMGVRMAIFSSVMSIFGVLGSALVSQFYINNISAFSYLLAVVIILACVVQWLSSR